MVTTTLILEVSTRYYISSIYNYFLPQALPFSLKLEMNHSAFPWPPARMAAVHDSLPDVVTKPSFLKGLRPY